MMSNPWMAALFALFVWWSSTGAILVVVKRSDRGHARRHLMSVLLGLPVLLTGIFGFLMTTVDTSVSGIYLAFLSALAIWGWIELTFLSGIITGPVPRPAQPDVSRSERFMRAWSTIAYHEILLVVALAIMAYQAWDAPNPFGFWTFATLFFARITAKLNLFFGVPRIHTEFLPDPLAHIPSHFRKGPVTPMFPVAVTALSFAVACWLERLYSATTAGDTVGFALLCALTTLALLEHWMMVLPLPDEKLYRWLLPAPRQTGKTLLREDTTHGL